MEWFVLRYTREDSNQNVILILLRDIFGTEAQIIVGHEFSKDDVEHTHSVIGTSYSFDSARQKFKGRTGLKRCKDEEGNKVYSMKRVTDLKGAIQYAIKGNKYTRTDIFPEEELLWAQDNPWKFPEVEFEEQYRKLDEKFLSREYNDWSYLQNVLALYATHNKGFMLHFIKQRYFRLANIANAAYFDPWAHSGSCPRQTFRDMLVYKILQI